LSPPTGYRLSPQQARLWTLLSEEPAAPYRASTALLLEGELDADLLVGAVRSVLSRHEILETAYHALPGTTAAVQAPRSLEAALHRLDWRDLSGTEQTARLDALLAERPSGAPPAGAPALHLMALGERQHLLAIQVPPLSADGASLVNLARELGQAYAASARPSALGDAPTQYADVAEVYNQLLDGEDTAEGRRYWAQRPELPRQGPRAFRPRSTKRTLPAGLTSALEAVAARLGVPVPHVVLACWQVLLFRVSSQDRGPVAVRFDGRTYEGLDEAIGLFERYLPVRCAPTEGRRFADFLGDVSRAMKEATAWQDAFDAARGPGLPYAFEDFRWPEPLRAGDLTLTPTRIETCTEPFELKLSCIRRGGGLELQLDHDAGLHTPAETTRTLERLVALLAGAAATPELPLDALTLVGEEDLRRLDGFNRTARSYDTDGTLHERFEEQVRRTPDADAVVFGDECLSFAALSTRANRLAWHLRGLGVGPEVRVGLLFERSVEQIVALLGILKAGGAFVPLDPLHPRERLAHTLQQAGAAHVVTRSTLRSLLPVEAARPLCLDTEAEALKSAPTSALDSDARSDNLAYVLFTSGSTGRPKGVMIPHRSVLNLAATLREHVYGGRGPGLRVSVNAPLVFDASVKQWAQLLYGDALYLVPEEARPDARRLRDFVRRHAIDVLDCTPSLLVPMLAQGLGREPDFSPALVLVGGEALDARAWEALARAERTRFVNVYGPTECTVDATACAIPSSAEPSIGWPLGNVRVHLLDPHRRPVPVGVPGELFIGGAGVARGYIGQPGLTAERFVPDPFGPAGSRLYRTGDLGRRHEEGRIEFLGRTDHQVKLHGFRIELGEIEQRMLAHPDIAEAVAVVREPSPGEAHLVAYFVPRASPVPEARQMELATALHAFLRKALPEYMMPRTLVPLARFPLNHNGKLDRSALPAPQAGLEDATPYEAPSTPLEQTIANIWRELLQVSKVGLHSNFFDLGGHSLLMVQVHERLSTALGKRFSMVELFQHPTVATLARYLGNSAQEPGAPAPASTTESLAERARRQRQSMQQQANLTKVGRGKK